MVIIVTAVVIIAQTHGVQIRYLFLPQFIVAVAAAQERGYSLRK